MILEITAHDENFKNQLLKDVLSVMEEKEIKSEEAFIWTVSRWLGYEPQPEYIVDGTGDRGLDFWYPSESGFDIFQLKTHLINEDSSINTSPFDKEGVMDLYRIKSYLIDEHGIPEHNARLKDFKERWNHLIALRKQSNTSEDVNNPIYVNLGLIVVGDGLTKQAQDELEALKRSLNEPIKIYDNVEVEIKVSLYTIKDIIEKRWREENRSWKSRTGTKQEWIELHAEDGKYIPHPKSSIFYCPAIDLVLAYMNYGYQIFEPNVRCNIKKSKVNLNIRKSISHRSSRKEFRFLNNGVTILAKNYSTPSKNRNSFKVYEPGIINGLQTVISISEAYEKLSKEEQLDFEENCYVLVRLLRQDAVKDPDSVVRATNNQNKMDPRNLLSNSPEQILYEKLFAEIGWFYERKEGAWHAFSSDPSRWRNLQRKKRSDFHINPNNLKSKPRKIDNVEIAQCWLSFIGYSNYAVHEKSQIFEREDWYNLIFLKRPTKHGAEVDFKINNSLDRSLNSSPNPELLLVAYLTKLFAREMTPSPKENFDDSCKRLGIDPSKKAREEVVAILTQDNDYLVGLALSGMSYVFVEYFGYALFKSLGENIHHMGNNLLSNGILNRMKTNFDIKEYKSDINNMNFEFDDIICVIWHSFRYVVNTMLSGYWAESFKSAPNRSRFIAQADTRLKLLKGLDDFNQFTSKAKWPQLWAAGIPEGKGIYGFINDVLK